jgi:hypothetical protein
MTNPLLDTFDEMYGEKKEEVVEDREEELREELSVKMDALHSGAFSISSANYPMHGQLTFNAATNELSVHNGLTNQVIPTATVSSGKISMNGDYIKADALISNSTSISTVVPNNFCFPNTTQMDQQFCKVMRDVADRKATVSELKAEIDTSFTGFGGQIRYTIEIVGRYP